MPEGSEIRRSTDYLRQRLVGKWVIDIRGFGGRYKDKLPVGCADLMSALLEGLTIADVQCKGKFQHWSLSPDWSLWCTYGMSGQWSGQHTPHCAMSIEHDGGMVHFNDPRHFGTLKFIHDPDGSKTQAKLDTLGPDMLSGPPTLEEFVRRMSKKPNCTIAEALLDQRRVSGVGNYVRAEALWLSELSPHRTCCSLSLSDWERLRLQIINVMSSAYQTGGATISTYRNPDGSKGAAQRRFAVYGHKVDILGNPVIREPSSDGRTIWWAPASQH